MEHDDQVDALGLIGQLLDKVIVAKRPVPKQQRPEWGYHHLQDSQIDRYVRNGSSAVNWSAAEDEQEFSWKTI